MSQYGTNDPINNLLTIQQYYNLSMLIQLIDACKWCNGTSFVYILILLFKFWSKWINFQYSYLQQAWIERCTAWWWNISFYVGCRDKLWIESNNVRWPRAVGLYKQAMNWARIGLRKIGRCRDEQVSVDAFHASVEFDKKLQITKQYYSHLNR